MNRAEKERLADRLLALIRTRPGERFTLAHLADELDLKADRLPALVGQLTEWGYAVNLTHRDLRLLGTPDSLTATELSWGLETRLIGKRILAYDSVKSTNDIASREGEQGAPEGTVVVADRQTSGRGRMGRVWHSPAAKGVYISILLRPKILPEFAPGLSLMTALSLALAIESYCKAKVKIKWPNDMIFHGKKVAGILTELSADRRKIHYVVVGVGINVNHDPTDFSDEISLTATSLREATGTEVSRVALVQRFLREFEREYELYRQELLAPVLPRLRRRSSMLGHTVRLDTGQEIIEGTAVDFDARGCLIVEREGERLVIAAGDVTVVKERPAR